MDKHVSDASVTPDLLIEIKMLADAANLKLIRHIVREMGDRLKCGSLTISDIVLAIDEGCQNIIRHAYAASVPGEMVVRLCHDRDKLIIDLLDRAEPVILDKIRPRNLDDIRPGGLGTHLMREVMDEMQFLPPPDGYGNCLRMVKKIR